MGIGPLSCKAVFLDRDGVLNEAVVRDGKPYPPASASEMRLVPGALAALEQLKQHGFLLVVVTNQPDVGRGKQERSTVEEMHHMMRAALPLDDVFACYHSDEDGCRCRKPLPGMMMEAAQKHGIDMPGSFLVGDRWRDIEAGQAAGCRTVLIDHGYHERGPAKPPDARVQSLGEAASWIIQESGQTR